MRKKAIDAGSERLVPLYSRKVIMMIGAWLRLRVKPSPSLLSSACYKHRTSLQPAFVVSDALSFFTGACLSVDLVIPGLAGHKKGLLTAPRVCVGVAARPWKVGARSRALAELLVSVPRSALLI